MGHGKIIIQEAQSVILSYVPKHKYSEEFMNNTVENDFFWISQGKAATSDR